MKKKLIEPKGKIGKSKIIVGEFKIPIVIIDKTSKQKISKEGEEGCQMCEEHK